MLEKKVDMYAAASEMKLCVHPESSRAMSDVQPSMILICMVLEKGTPVMAWSEKWGLSSVASSSGDSDVSSLSSTTPLRRKSLLQTLLWL